MKEISYSKLQRNLFSVLHRVANDNEGVNVRMNDGRRIVVIPGHELAGFLETVHLLRSPKNAQRLLAALSRCGKVRHRGRDFTLWRR